MYRIKEIRKAKGISQEKLSQDSGVCRATIWRLESGNYDVAMSKTLSAIAKALDVQISDLFYSENA